MDKDGLRKTVSQLFANGLYMLKIDECPDRLNKCFEKHGIANTMENRHKFRNLIIEMKDLEKYVGSVILHPEAFEQKNSDGISLVDIIARKDIILGIRLDKGQKNINYEDAKQAMQKGLKELEEGVPEEIKKGFRNASEKGKEFIKRFSDHDRNKSDKQTGGDGDKNTVNDMKEKTKQGAGKLKEKVSEGAEKLKDTGKKISQSAKQQGQHAGNVAGETKESAKGKTASGKDKLKETGKKISQSAKQQGQHAGNVAGETKESAKGKTASGKDKLKETGKKISQSAKQQGQHAGNVAGETKESAKGKTASGKDKLKETGEKASQSAKQQGQHAGNVAGETKKNVKGKAKDADKKTGGDEKAAEEPKENAKSKMEEGVDKIKEKSKQAKQKIEENIPEDVKKKTRDATEKTTKFVKEKSEAVKNKVNEKMGKSGNTAGEMKEEAKSKGSEAVEQTKEKNKEATDKMGSGTAQMKDKVASNTDKQEGGEDEVERVRKTAEEKCRKIKESTSNRMEFEKEIVGLNDLEHMLQNGEYKKAKIAKYGCTFTITNATPTFECIDKNTTILAKFTQLCLAHMFVPAIEMAIDCHGNFTAEEHHRIVKHILSLLIHKLNYCNIDLSCVIIMIGFVTAGKKKQKTEIMETVKYVADIIESVIPRKLSGIVFSCNGHTIEELSDYLEVLCQDVKNMHLTLSYSGCCFEGALQEWSGDDSKTENVQHMLMQNYEKLHEVLKKYRPVGK